MKGTASTINSKILKNVENSKKGSFNKGKNVSISVSVEPKDPATATIEALKTQSVVFLNSSVQIFRADVKGNNSASASPFQNSPQYQSEDEVVESPLALDALSSSSEEDECDEDDNVCNGWDDFGWDEPSDKTIDYICRRCGTTFQSSSDGEYYFCSNCRPLSDDGNSQGPLVPPTLQLNYAKYSCKNCGVNFYSKVGNYNLCEVCSGLHTSLPSARMNPINTKNNGPFSWGYTKKECCICLEDFYNRLENWYICPRCVTESCPSKSKKKSKKSLNKSIRSAQEDFKKLNKSNKEIIENKLTGTCENTQCNEEKNVTEENSKDTVSNLDIKIENDIIATIKMEPEDAESLLNPINDNDARSNKDYTNLIENVKVIKNEPDDPKDILNPADDENGGSQSSMQSTNILENTINEPGCRDELLGDVNNDKKIDDSRSDMNNSNKTKDENVNTVKSNGKLAKESLKKIESENQDSNGIGENKKEDVELKQLTTDSDCVMKIVNKKPLDINSSNVSSLNHKNIQNYDSIESNENFKDLERKPEEFNNVSIKVESGDNKDSIYDEIKYDSEVSAVMFKYILYACKLCKKTYYSNLIECFYCHMCCNTHSIVNRAKRLEGDIEQTKFKRLVAQESLKAEKYEKYSCKVCSQEFYSTIGEWDFCSDCEMENNCTKKAKSSRVVSSFTRKNVTFNRYTCNICKNFFFCSREEHCCKKCTKIMTSMKIHPSSDDENKWENVVYAKYICKSCDKPFYSKVGEYHYCSECNPETKMMIKNKKMFGCAHCEYKTHLKKELRRHILTIPRDRKRRCPCSQCYETAIPLAEGETQEALEYKCKRCDYTTKHKKRLKMHKNMVHKGKVPLYSCKHCKFKSCHKARLKCHIMTRHEGLKVYQCEQCEYATRQTGRLMMHIAVVHQGEKPYACTVCSEKFGTRAALKAHTSSVHDSPKTCQLKQLKLLKCDKCEFTATYKTEMKAHIVRHEEDHNLICSPCNFTTAKVNSLVQHVFDSHKSSTTLPCTMCNYKCKQRQRLKRHIISRHVGDNRYRCDRCSYYAPDIENLKKHVTFNHHRPKKYKKNNVIQQCPYCDYTVKQVKRFMDHVSTVHPDEQPPQPVITKRRGTKRRHNKKSSARKSVGESSQKRVSENANVDEEQSADNTDQPTQETSDHQEVTSEPETEETSSPEEGATPAKKIKCDDDENNPQEVNS